VIYNPLHDQSYPSIDEPTTTPVNKGEDQRGSLAGVRSELNVVSMHLYKLILNVVSRQLYKSVIKFRSIRKNKDEQLKFVRFYMLVDWIVRTGKSTLAVEIARYLDLSIPCERLDGDIIRTNLSKG